MFEMSLTLAAAAIVLEVFLVRRYVILLELFERNSLLSVAFSLVLSWLLGEAFGAAGMTVLLAALASTAAMAVIYRTGALLAVERLVSQLQG